MEDIRIIAPVARDTYDVWVKGGFFGSGKTKVEAITAAQRELNHVQRELTEMAWRENGGGLVPCLENLNPTER